MPGNPERLRSLIETIQKTEAELEIIEADSKLTKSGRRRNAAIAGEKDVQRGLAPGDRPNVRRNTLPQTTTLQERG
jgi:hypothetical protein